MRRHMIVVLVCLLPLSAAAKEHIVEATARDFLPDVLVVEPGDTVRFTGMASHAVVTVEGLIPEGARPWASALGEDVIFTPEREGIYGFVCPPHLSLGMVGIIVVGTPLDLDAKLDWARAHLQGPHRRLIGKLLKLRRNKT